MWMSDEGLCRKFRQKYHLTLQVLAALPNKQVLVLSISQTQSLKGFGMQAFLGKFVVAQWCGSCEFTMKLLRLLSCSIVSAKSLTLATLMFVVAMPSLAIECSEAVCVLLKCQLGHNSAASWRASIVVYGPMVQCSSTSLAEPEQSFRKAIAASSSEFVLQQRNQLAALINDRAGPTRFTVGMGTNAVGVASGVAALLGVENSVSCCAV